MDKLYLGYKNNFKYEQEKRAKAKHKKSSSMSNIPSYTNNHKTFSPNKNFIDNSSTIRDTAEDYQRLAKKFYCIIISIQDELTRQTVKNYSLLEENLNLKQQISEIQKNKNIN